MHPELRRLENECPSCAQVDEGTGPLLKSHQTLHPSLWIEEGKEEATEFRGANGGGHATEAINQLQALVEDQSFLKEQRGGAGDENGGQMFRCGECGFECLDQPSFHAHRLLHNEDSGHLHCPYCNYKVLKLRKEHLLIHIRRHTGERPFACSECAKRFASKCDLNTHAKLHGEKAYACRFCAYRAHRNSSVRLHELKQHGVG